ncbi:hypothetical protein BJ912DRAFT_980751 [Pholiota molesta]|nr:hypothetical protein BJ912DRAFT_980751 [Pholiota molesta]
MKPRDHESRGKADAAGWRLDRDLRWRLRRTVPHRAAAPDGTTPAPPPVCTRLSQPQNRPRVRARHCDSEPTVLLDSPSHGNDSGHEIASGIPGRVPPRTYQQRMLHHGSSTRFLRRAVPATQLVPECAMATAIASSTSWPSSVSKRRDQVRMGSRRRSSPGRAWVGLDAPKKAVDWRVGRW